MTHAGAITSRTESGGVTLVLPEAMHDELARAAGEPLETAGVLLCSVLTTLARARVLVEDVRWVPAEGYVRRDPDGLSVASAGYIAALNEAEVAGLTPVWFHTHPGVSGSARPSHHDAAVDAELADVFRLRSGASHYGSVIAASRPGLIGFTGRLADEHATHAMDRLVVVGDGLAVRHADDAGAADQTQGYDLFSRNVLAFGGPVQDALSQLAVAIVGCGGTGSAVAEQLVRLGVRDLILVDPDELETSNLTRVYGSTASDTGEPKSHVLAAHLSRIAPDLTVVSVVGSLNQETVARRLVDRDVVFGCTDDNSGRMVLSRVAAFLRIVVIDCGVLISSTPDGVLRGIDARVTIMKPGAACLLCRARIDTARAAAELMSTAERGRLAADGYAPALPGVQPAVVAYTTMIAAHAVAELLELLTGYGPQPRPTELLVRVHDREISTNTVPPTAGHFCDPTARRPGAGTQSPFLDKVWGQ